MKKFDDFLSTLTDDDFDEMLKKSVDAINSRKKLNAVTDINDICLLQNIMLLRRYHSWLAEQLGLSLDD